MAFTRMGFGGELLFDNRQAVKAMQESRTEFGRFQKTTDDIPRSVSRMGAMVDKVTAGMRRSIDRVTAGAKQLGGALRGAALATTIATVALGASVGQAASFEKQMSAVGAITGATGSEFEKLTDKAKQMGIVSTFSASESGQAMEFMARAGATTDQIVAGLGGVMNAAAADGMELAQASNVISQTVKGMGLQFEQAGHVADVLALTSARSNTNIIQLGDAMRYAMPQARSLGIETEELSGLLGKVADAGLQGSIGGTSLTNMLVKLSKPSKKARDLMKQFDVSLTNADGSLRNVSAIVADFHKGLQKIPDVTERGAAQAELFGIRGQKAFSALAVAGEKSTNTLIESLKKSSEAQDEHGNVVGAAALMAARRLDNLSGRVKLFFSSLEAFSIELFGPMLKPLASNVKFITDQFNKVLFAIQLIKREGLDKGLGKATEKYGKTISLIAAGVVDAIDWMKSSWDGLVDLVRRAGEWIEENVGAERIRQFTKWGIIIGVVAGAMGPVLIALTGIGAVLSMVVIPAIGGLISIASGLWPIFAIFGLIAIAIQLMRRENESFLQAAQRLWGYVKTAALDVWNTAIKPLWQGIKDGAFILDELKLVWTETVGVAKQSFLDLMATFDDGTKKQDTNWREIGRTIASVLGAVLIAIMKVVQFFIWAGSKILPIIYTNIIGPLSIIWQHLKFVGGAISDLFSGNILRGLAKLGVALLDTMLLPLRIIIQQLIKVADMIGFGGKIPTSLRNFIKEGLSGALFPKKKIAAAPPRERRRTRIRVPGVPRAKAPAEAEGITFGESFGKEIAAGISDLATADKTGAKKAANAAKTAADAAKALAGRKCPDINVHSKLSVDGKTLAKATSKHQQEVSERTGFKTTPWQRRRMAELGATTTGG